MFLDAELRDLAGVSRQRFDLAPNDVVPDLLADAPCRPEDPQTETILAVFPGDDIEVLERPRTTVDRTLEAAEFVRDLRDAGAGLSL